jgi:D-glycero-D-manno-heptose 1,7-bisphosphate phosphatase
MRSLIIFDKDGTLVTSTTSGPPNKVSEQVPIPGVAYYCERMRAEGQVLAVASNQGGVAFGYTSLEEATAMVRAAADLIGAAAYRLCPYHPEGIVFNDPAPACRKPEAGMLLELMGTLRFKPSETLMVGDDEADRGAAENAGVTFMFADDFWAFCAEVYGAVPSAWLMGHGGAEGEVGAAPQDGEQTKG